MNWTDLTDILFCRAYGHMFTIKKPQYRNDVIEWCCTKEGEVIAEGKTVRISIAKTACKEVFKKIKQDDKNIYVKANGKLTRKRYATSRTA